MNKATHCVIWGGYGWGNVGDELTLAVAIRDLRAQGITNISILSVNPTYTKTLFPSESVVPYEPVVKSCKIWKIAEKICLKLLGYKFNFPVLKAKVQVESNDTWVKYIRNADLLYLVGGGYFSSLFPIFSHFILPVEVANIFRIPVHTAPLGIGPFNNQKTKKRFLAAFRDLSIVVRDETSAQFCRSNKIEASEKKDDGFRALEVIDVQRCEVHSPKKIGVNYYAQHGLKNYAAYKEWWKSFLIIAKSHQLPIEGFCFHNNETEDYASTCELFTEVGIPTSNVKKPKFDFRDSCKDLFNYSVIASSRFHAVVVARALRIPCLGISSGEYYSTKMKAACNEADIAYHALTNTVDPRSAFEVLLQMSVLKNENNKRFTE